MNPGNKFKVNVNESALELFKVTNTGVHNSTKQRKKQSPRFRSIKPWITYDLVSLIRERDNVSKLLKRQRYFKKLL